MLTYMCQTAYGKVWVHGQCGSETRSFLSFDDVYVVASNFVSYLPHGTECPSQFSFFFSTCLLHSVCSGRKQVQSRREGTRMGELRLKIVPMLILLLAFSGLISGFEKDGGQSCCWEGRRLRHLQILFVACQARECTRIPWGSLESHLHQSLITGCRMNSSFVFKG